MSEINEQNINTDQQNQLLNQSQILNPKQQTWSPDALTQVTQKHRMKSIKIAYPEQRENSYEERQIYAKSQTKNKIFYRRRILTNRLETQVCSKQSKQETSYPKVQQNDSLTYQPYLSKRTNFKTNTFFDQVILSPKQKLESFKSQLKAVRQQNETYLKNKMNLIKQKIKRKRQSEPNQRTKGRFWSNKYEKTKDRSNEKKQKFLKIQKYNDLLQQDMIRKSIQIQKCQVLNYNSQDKLTLQQENRVQDKSDKIKKQKKCNRQPAISVLKEQIKIKGQNKIKISIIVSQSQRKENYKMMVVNRLSPLKNVISVIKPEKSLQKKKIDSDDLQVGLFFNIKAFDKAIETQTSSHKYSKSFDIGLMKKIEKKLSQVTTAHNFIKGSVIYRLLKQRNQQKIRQDFCLQAKNSQKKIQINNKVLEVKRQLVIQKPIFQNTEVLEQPQIKKKVVVLSNKNITKYKSEYQGRIKYGQIKNKIDQNQQQFRFQLFQEQQQKK